MYRNCIAPDSDMLNQICIAFKKYHLYFLYLKTNQSQFVCLLHIVTLQPLSMSAQECFGFQLCRHLTAGEVYSYIH